MEKEEAGSRKEGRIKDARDREGLERGGPRRKRVDWSLEIRDFSVFLSRLIVGGDPPADSRRAALCACLKPCFTTLRV